MNDTENNLQDSFEFTPTINKIIDGCEFAIKLDDGTFFNVEQYNISDNPIKFQKHDIYTLTYSGNDPGYLNPKQLELHICQSKHKSPKIYHSYSVQIYITLFIIYYQSIVNNYMEQQYKKYKTITKKAPRENKESFSIHVNRYKSFIKQKNEYSERINPKNYFIKTYMIGKYKDTYFYVCDMYTNSYSTFQNIIDNNITIESNDLIKIFYDILIAVDLLRKCGILYDDLNMENILYDRFTKKILIANFQSAIIENAFTHKRSLKYDSPSIRDGYINQYFNSRDGMAIYSSNMKLKNKGYIWTATVWSLGIIFYYLYKREHPYIGEDNLIDIVNNKLDIIKAEEDRADKILTIDRKREECFKHKLTDRFATPYMLFKKNSKQLSEFDTEIKYKEYIKELINKNNYHNCKKKLTSSDYYNCIDSHSSFKYMIDSILIYIYNISGQYSETRLDDITGLRMRGNIEMNSFFDYYTREHNDILTMFKELISECNAENPQIITPYESKFNKASRIDDIFNSNISDLLPSDYETLISINNRFETYTYVVGQNNLLKYIEEYNNKAYLDYTDNLKYNYLYYKMKIKNNDDMLVYKIIRNCLDKANISIFESDGITKILQLFPKNIINNDIQYLSELNRLYYSLKQNIKDIYGYDIIQLYECKNTEIYKKEYSDTSIKKKKYNCYNVPDTPLKDIYDNIIKNNQPKKIKWFQKQRGGTKKQIKKRTKKRKLI